MRIAIIGTRDAGMVDCHWLAQYVPSETTLIISGGAKGIDTYAEEYAQSRGISFFKIIPDYKKYGKNAPLIRNQEIVDRVDRVLAFWDYTSRGTASVIAYCIERGKPVDVIGLPGCEPVNWSK